MRIVFTGKGTSGSWQMRGVQLGHACDAIVKAQADDVTLAHAHIIVGVKRISQDLLERIKGARAKFVWDVVDAYPQIKNQFLTKDAALLWFASELKRLQPDGVIFPNERMQMDCALMLGKRKHCVIKHHAQINTEINKINETVSVIGYQGSPQFLDKEITKAIRGACKRHNLIFKESIEQYADCDIAIAMRGRAWTSYPIYHWKPATKLNNAICAQTPMICNREAGYLEISTGMEVFVDDARYLEGAIESLMPYERRLKIARSYNNRKAYNIADAARDMKEFLYAL